VNKTLIGRFELFLGVILTGMYFFFLNPYVDVKGFNQHDPIEYLIRASTIWKGLGYGVAFADQYLGVTVQPPGFSLLLSPIVGIFGFHFTILKLFMVSTAIVFAVTLFYFFRHFISNKALIYFCILTVMSSPAIFGLSHRIMSDIPFFICVTLALIFLDSTLKDKSSMLDLTLFLAAIFTLLAYSFKLTAVVVVAGGWFLILHPQFRNKQTLVKLLIFTFCHAPKYSCHVKEIST